MRGCEVTSLAMVLQFSGVQVDKMELAAKDKVCTISGKGIKGICTKGLLGI